MSRYFHCLLLLGITLSACKKIEYSPNQAKTTGVEGDLNRKNIEALLAKENDDTLRIAFIGDTQRFYDETELFVDKVNTIPGVDLVIVAGDLSDFGLAREFQWVNRIFAKLKMPYICIIGNHDMLANGTEIYRNTYGPTDFSFVYDSVKFVCLNTNGLEAKFNGTLPDIGWLRQQMISGPEVKRILPVSHVPAYDGDFDPALKQPYAETIRNSGKTGLSLHGHYHEMNDFYPFDDGVRCINAWSMDKNRFLLIDLVDASVNVNQLSY